jgi:cell division protein FtsL
MQFNFLSLHATLLFKRNLYSSELNLMLLISTLLYTLILILTDYRSLLKIYRYENHILREDYPIIEFLGI